MKMVKMYLLKKDNNDYISVCDDKINVHSGLLKHMWSDPNKINFNNFTFPYTVETYYGDLNVLNDAELLWEHQVE